MKIGVLKSSIGIVLGIAFIGLVVVGIARGWFGARGPTPLSPEALEFQVHQALQTKQWATAESLLKDLPPARAAAADVAILRAELEGSQGRVDNAAVILAGSAETDPLAAKSRLLIGQIKKSRDQARAMETAFLDALRLDPSLSQARRELALLYEMQGRRDELKTQFEALAKLGEMDMKGVFLWTNTNEDIAYGPTNRQTLEKCVAADPDDRWSRLALAELLIRTEEGDDVEKAKEILKPLPDSDIEALGIRVRIALKRSRLEEARAMLAGNPAEHRVLCRLRGQLAIKDRDLKKAIEQFQCALRLDPFNLEVALGLAGAYRQAGDPKQEQAYRDLATRLRALNDLMKEQFQNIVQGKVDPTMPKRLAAACEAAGRIDVAIAWYQLAVGVDPLDASVQKALHALRLRSAPGS